MTKKNLGQNFLVDKNKIKEIVGALELENGDTIIEIGPGHGELTRELKIKGGDLKIIAIEKDGELAERLREESSKTRGVEIITGDALKILPNITKSCKLKTKNYKIVGNIPYYITGFLLRTLGELKIKPKLIVLTVQKEVAERIAAKPPKMNLLAAAVQFWAEPEIVDIIPKTDFSPEPKVDSAIIKLVPRSQKSKKAGRDYYQLVRGLFKQPRKTISNNLSEYFRTTKNRIADILDGSSISPGARPQDLEQKTIQKLSEILYNAMGDSISTQSDGQKKRKAVH